MQQVAMAEVSSRLTRSRGTMLALGGLGLFILGVALTAAAVQSGDASVYLVVIFPIITSSSAIGGLSMLAIIGGLFLASVGWNLRQAEQYWDSEGDEHYESPSHRAVPAGSGSGSTGSPAGLVMLGPIPIVLGGDARSRSQMRRVGWFLSGAITILFVILLLSFFGLLG